MREIKFRAWDSEKKQMARVSMLGEEEAHLYKVTGETWVSPKHYVAVIMQYTGLKDKNGVEIYEGDIVRWTRLCISFDLKSYETRSDNLEVTWCDYNASFLAQDGTPFYKGDSIQYEVIGNIYENPVLLERETE